jgi:alkylation response protein AidB-like acyl-CoA dehydrogenase
MSDFDFLYNDPIEDHKFLLTNVLKVDEKPWLQGMPDEETRGMLLSEVESFFSSVVSPLRLSSDIEGVRLENGRIHTPKGYAEAYKQLCEIGFNAPTIPEEMGGAGLSYVFNQFLEEFGTSASVAFLMYFGFATSSCHAISKFGDATLIEKTVPKLVSGEWLATMALTEPHAGSNLAEVRTLAKRRDDGTFSITGDKVFITGGDSDLADNIVHVVLARTEDENGTPLAGIGGLGVFVVTRDDLDTGEDNGVEVVGIEHKMGLNGGATCSMHFDNAKGYQLAPGGKGSAAGMAPLFEMMNHARLGTAVTGVGVAAKAAEMTTAYAMERTAGSAAGLARNADGSGHPIICHPDIYRIIASAWSFVEGTRATLIWGALLIADSHEHTDENERKESGLMAHLLVPLLKAYATDTATQICDDCIQVFGGYGYVRETGIEQLFRDLRASRIYEGANGVQANDFVMRRMAGKGEQAIKLLIAKIRKSIEDFRKIPALTTLSNQLTLAVDSLERISTIASETRENDVRALLAVSLDIVHLFGIVLVGWRSTVSVIVAHESNSPLLERKMLLAKNWATRQLPMTAGLEARIQSCIESASEEA